MQITLRRVLGIGVLSLAVSVVSLPWLTSAGVVEAQTQSGVATGTSTESSSGSSAADEATASLPGSAMDAPQRAMQALALRSEAIKSLEVGDFEKTTTLINQAVKLSPDQMTEQMAGWVHEFDQQRARAVDERHKEFDAAVKDVHLLVDNQKDDFALDTAARAYLLADDKEAFRKEQWIDDLINRCVKLAENDDQSQKWLKSLRIYSSLSSLEPANPEWKDRLKATTRRIRLLATYAPERFKAVQESEIKERDEVLVMLKPTTQPATTKPADQDIASNFEISWKDSLRGVKMDMLLGAMDQARENYWRDVDYKMLVLGGLKGVEAMATTPGLEDTFAGLGDGQKLDAFKAAVEDCRKMANDPANRDDDRLPRQVLTRLRAASAATVALPEEVLISEFSDGAFAELDPFTNAIWPSDVEEFRKGTQGEFSGVGIQIETADDGGLRVVSPLEDSPAYRAGIKAGDVITQIDGKSAKGITLTQAVRTITGPSGTHVKLTVRSLDNTVHEFDLLRETIKVASVKGWKHLPGGGWDYFVDPENKIGYIRLTNFTEKSAEDLSAAVDDMKAHGVRGVILDLRYNPGGLLKSATAIVDKFLGAGLIVSTRADRETQNPPSSVSARDDGNEFAAPLVVLVNQYSASASEIVSGALKDQHRALIVGERTFGKGSVQMIFPLSDRGDAAAYLKLTTSHYYLPNGKCIHREENSTEWGVDPNVVVALTPEQMQAAIKSRQGMDVLRDAGVAPEATTAPTTQDATMGPTEADPQLGAALLVLRMQLAGQVAM